jgi:hypothetical protein
MEVTGVFKKAQMLPLSFHGVMYRAKLTCFIREAGAGYKIDMQMKLATGGFICRKGHVFDLPRGLQA